MEKKEIGRVSHYFGGPGVAAIELTDRIAVGDRISFAGHTTDFEMTVESMQIEHASVQQAGRGESIGIKVPQKVREHDAVFKIVG
jgi:putative protease